MREENAPAERFGGGVVFVPHYRALISLVISRKSPFVCTSILYLLKSFWVMALFIPGSLTMDKLSLYLNSKGQESSIRNWRMKNDLVETIDLGGGCAFLALGLYVLPMLFQQVAITYQFPKQDHYGACL